MGCLNVPAGVTNINKGDDGGESEIIGQEIRVFMLVMSYVCLLLQMMSHAAHIFAMLSGFDAFAITT